jgi:AraC-like DNA-binding protein
MLGRFPVFHSYDNGVGCVARLSNQFKKVTGITPTRFKNQKDKERSCLEDI